MRTSVYKNIIDDSIEGVKIKDETNVEDFGTLYARYFYARQSGGSNVGQLLSTGGNGSLVLRDSSEVKFNLDADTTGQSYVLNSILFGVATPYTSTESYPLQIGTNAYVRGNSYFYGTVTAKTTLKTQASNGIVINTVQPSSTNWQNLLHLDQDVGIGSSPSFADPTLTGELTVASSVVPTSVWPFVKTMDQDVASDSDPQFGRLLTDNFSSKVQSVNASISINSDLDWSILFYNEAGSSWILTLDYSQVGNGKWYYVVNSRSSGSVTISAAVDNTILYALSGDVVLSQFESALVVHLSQGNWAVLKGGNPLS